MSKYIIMARTKTNEEKAQAEKSPKRRNSGGDYHFQFFEKKHKKKLLEGSFQKKVQTAINGADHTVTTDAGKRSHRKFISGPSTFHEERKAALKIGDNTTPKNRHCLRGVDGKYIQWNERCSEPEIEYRSE